MTQIENVTKSFEKRKALDNISFTLNDGEIVGFVELNSAGKTNTIGTIYPDPGDLLIDVYNVAKEKKIVSRNVGWVLGVVRCPYGTTLRGVFLD